MEPVEPPSWTPFPKAAASVMSFGWRQGRDRGRMNKVVESITCRNGFSKPRSSRRLIPGRPAIIARNTISFFSILSATCRERPTPRTRPPKSPSPGLFYQTRHSCVTNFPPKEPKACSSRRPRVALFLIGRRAADPDDKFSYNLNLATLRTDDI